MLCWCQRRIGSLLQEDSKTLVAKIISCYSKSMQNAIFEHNMLNIEKDRAKTLLTPTHDNVTHLIVFLIWYLMYCIHSYAYKVSKSFEKHRSLCDVLNSHKIYKHKTFPALRHWKDKPCIPQPRMNIATSQPSHLIFLPLWWDRIRFIVNRILCLHVAATLEFVGY